MEEVVGYKQKTGTRPCNIQPGELILGSEWGIFWNYFFLDETKEYVGLLVGWPNQPCSHVFRGKPEWCCQRKQPSHDYNIMSQISQQTSFHLTVCTFTLFCISQKPHQVVKSHWFKQCFGGIFHRRSSIRTSNIHIKTGKWKPSPCQTDMTKREQEELWGRTRSGFSAEHGEVLTNSATLWHNCGWWNCIYFRSQTEQKLPTKITSTYINFIVCRQYLAW